MGSEELSREEDEDIEVDFEKSEIRLVKKYRLWHDFNGVKVFFVLIQPGYAKYVEQRGDDLYLVESDLEKGGSKKTITKAEAAELVKETVEHWLPHYEWCE